jgi:hypothetical protein
MSAVPFDVTDPASFLRTVLVVDDQALTADDERERAQEVTDDAVYHLDVPESLTVDLPAHDDGAPEDAVEPSLEEGEALSGSTTADVESLAPRTANVAGGALRTRRLVNAFAERGIGCSVLAPVLPDEDDRARVLLLARTTDIVVLDWLLRPPDTDQPSGPGPETTSLELVKEIVAADLSSGGRLRLLCLYTSEAATEYVLESLRQGLVETFKKSANHKKVRPTLAGDELILDAGPLRIRVVRKQTEDGAEGVDEHDLADLLINEFVRFAADGLMPRLAISAVSAVRRHTHRLLMRFSQDLDPAFLSYRALTSPYIAEQYALALIGDELTSVLAATHVNAAVGQSAVDQRVEELIPPGGQDLDIPNRAGSKAAEKVRRDEAVRFLKESRDAKPLAPLTGDPKPMKDWATVAALMLSSSTEPMTAGRESEQAFAALCLAARTARHDGPDLPSPTLSMGSVLRTNTRKVGEDGTRHTVLRYWLCVQPLCDSVRLAVDVLADFLLVPLTVASESRFQLVVDELDESHHVYLVANQLRIADVQVVRFAASPQGVVEANWDTRLAGWVFRASGPNRIYRWVCDLRVEQAHRTATGIANLLARPGYDEPEFVRIAAKNTR